jgi:hypothetical protein
MTYYPGWGKEIFDKHMGYLIKGDIEGMVRETYTPNASLYSAWPIPGNPPPPNVFTGTEILIVQFKKYMEYQGEIKVDDMYNFLDSEDVISFQAVITTNSGTWAVSDTWLMEGEMKTKHFGTAHKL